MGITVDSGHGFVLAKVVGADGSPVRWSAPLFITITGGGVGGTVGMAEVNTCVVLTTPDAVQRFGHASSDWGPVMSAAVGKGGRQYSTACLLARCAALFDTLRGLSGWRLCHCVWPGMCARQCPCCSRLCCSVGKAAACTQLPLLHHTHDTSARPGRRSLTPAVAGHTSVPGTESAFAEDTRPYSTCKGLIVDFSYQGALCALCAAWSCARRCAGLVGAHAIAEWCLVLRVRDQRQ